MKTLAFYRVLYRVILFHNIALLQRSEITELSWLDLICKSDPLNCELTQDSALVTHQLICCLMTAV